MNELQDHMFRSYLNLRYGMAIIAATFPIVVYFVGWLDGVPLQDSISAYYWANVDDDARARVWFVGGLFAVAAFLYLYKGFTHKENIALNLAALFAVGVAVFPTARNCASNCAISVHGISAVMMFVCLVYVVWFCAQDTLHLLPPDGTGKVPVETMKQYQRRYLVAGAIMLASPLTAFVLNSLIGTKTSFIFFIECAGIWAFSYYWWLKSSELRKSGGTTRALCGEVDLNRAGKPTAVPPATPRTPVQPALRGAD